MEKAGVGDGIPDGPVCLRITTRTIEVVVFFFSFSFCFFLRLVVAFALFLRHFLKLEMHCVGVIIVVTYGYRSMLMGDGVLVFFFSLGAILLGLGGRQVIPYWYIQCTIEFAA